VEWKNLDEVGNPRITSQAFQDYPPEECQRLGVPARAMSVSLGPKIRDIGALPDLVLKNWPPEYGLAVLQGGDVRSCDQGILPWPTGPEPWHGLVFTKEGNKRTTGKQKCLARYARWLVLPPNSNRA
jgi:hypothetical protein